MSRLVGLLGSGGATSLLLECLLDLFVLTFIVFLITGGPIVVVLLRLRRRLLVAFQLTLLGLFGFQLSLESEVIFKVEVIFCLILDGVDVLFLKVAEAFLIGGGLPFFSLVAWGVIILARVRKGIRNIRKWFCGGKFWNLLFFLLCKFGLLGLTDISRSGLALVIFDFK
jgi:hypothetical protein